MAFSDEYEKLSDKDKERFGKAVNTLLTRTFILKQDLAEDGMKFSDEYYFASANIDLINSYLEVIGCRADNNTLYGVLSLASFPDSYRTHFDKLATQMIYTLRLIYEERRDALDTVFVSITAGELITKMIDINLFDRKPSNKDISQALRKIRNANIIEKGKGAFDSENTRIMILPSILMVLSETKLRETFERLRKESSSEEDADENA